MALEMDALKRDREVIVKEVLTLRKQQQAHQEETDMLHTRLNQTEQLHQQLLKALTSAVQDPAVQQAIATRPSLQITDGEPAGTSLRLQLPRARGICMPRPELYRSAAYITPLVLTSFPQVPSASGRLSRPTS